MQRKSSQLPQSTGTPERDDRYRSILETAARLICERGFDGTSMQDIADGCALTKAGLYHYIRTKNQLLLEIMHYGMDLFEEQVLGPVLPIADPVERMRACMEKNILLVTCARSKEITIILHEHATLTGEAREQIDARKKRYVQFLESTIAEAIAQGQMRPVNARVAAFSFLGMVLWTYKWFQPGGELSEQDIAQHMLDLFFSGLAVPTKSWKQPLLEGSTT
jgi:AcrR family transcriptional regulator